MRVSRGRIKTLRLHSRQHERIEWLHDHTILNFVFRHELEGSMRTAAWNSSTRRQKNDSRFSESAGRSESVDPVACSGRSDHADATADFLVGPSESIPHRTQSTACFECERRAWAIRSHCSRPLYTSLVCKRDPDAIQLTTEWKWATRVFRVDLSAIVDAYIESFCK